MSNKVVRRIDRAPSAAVHFLAEAGVATVHEAAGRVGLLDPSLKPIQQGVSIAGSAVTVLCPPDDNMMVHAAVEVVEPGDVLVVATMEPSTHGMFGDLLATSFLSRGLAGLVIDAGVRDTATLREMTFPVWSRVIHSQGTVKERPGSVNLPVVIGNQHVHPGDVIVADDDGVMVVRLADAVRVADASRARLEKEVITRDRLEAGELSVDFYGFRDKLLGLGVEWVDRPEEH